MDICTGSGSVQKLDTEGRRALLVILLRGIWSVMAVMLGVPAIKYICSVPKTKTSEEWSDIGNLNEVPTGQPIEVVIHRNRIEGWNKTDQKLTAWVTRTSDTMAIALGSQCTHLGCAHHWDAAKNEFVCPCHNSRFSITGDVLSGPAPRPLDRYEVKMRGSRVLIGDLILPERIR